MKANELRVGNLVLFDKMIVSILEISQDEIWCKQIKKTTKSGIILCHLSELKPIELNNKWFLKLGFKKGIDMFLSSNTIMYSIFKLRIRIMANYYTFCNECSFTKIEYVHQLQNLYFALCGEELVFSTEP